MSAPEDRTKDIRDIQPERLIKYRISDDHFSAEVLLPGLWYTDFDKKIGGKWTLQAMTELIEGTRALVERKGYVDHFDLVGETRTFFTTNGRYDFSRTANKVTFNDEFGLNFPLLVKVYVTHIGNSSLTEEFQVLNSTKDVLFTAFYKYVFVDFGTRKSTPLPTYLKDKWKKTARSKEERTFSRSDPLEVPSNAHVYEVKALHTDADSNDHVNQNIYVKWIISAAADAVKENNLSGFKSDIMVYPFESLVLQHLGEVNLTDHVTVHCWEDSASAKTLHFSMTNKGAQVFTASLKFYPDSRL